MKLSGLGGSWCKHIGHIDDMEFEFMSSEGVDRCVRTMQDFLCANISRSLISTSCPQESVPIQAFTKQSSKNDQQ